MTTVPCTVRPRLILLAASEPLTEMSGSDCGGAAAKKFAGTHSNAVKRRIEVISRILFRLVAFIGRYSDAEILSEYSALLGHLLRVRTQAWRLCDRCELPAGGKNIPAARLAHESMNALRLKNPFEHFHSSGRRRLIRQRIGRVVRNQIYLRVQIMSVEQVC